MAPSHSTIRCLVLPAALIGALCSLLATVVSYWGAVGATPAFLYGRSIRLSTLVRWSGIPLEFFEFAWFTAVLLAFTLVPVARGDQADRTVPTWTFLSSIPLAGLGLWLTAARSASSWPVTVLALMALIILSATAFSAGPVRSAVPLLLAVVRSAPRARRALLGGLCLIVVAALSMQVTVRTRNTDARERAFRTWYTAQRHAVPVAGDRIDVVLFTDYQCPACSGTVPAKERLIDEFRGITTLDVNFTTRDYPLESECNSYVSGQIHPAACEAAAAVRFVRAKLGEEAGRDIARVWYRNFRRLSLDFIVAHLETIGVAEDFRSEYPALVDLISTDAAEGARLGVRSTPTFMVNGVRLPNATVLDLALKLEAERLERGSGQVRAWTGGAAR